MMMLTTEELDPIDYEAITVSATAIGLTAGKLKPASPAPYRRRVFITNDGAAVRIRFDGQGAPTATNGHVLADGDSITLSGIQTLANFLAIRKDAVDSNLRVTYLAG